jgi:hypothetical protein
MMMMTTMVGQTRSTIVTMIPSRNIPVYVVVVYLIVTLMVMVMKTA